MLLFNRYRIGFFATRVCDHPLCSAESPNSPLTLRFWRVSYLAKVTAQAAGWQILDRVDFCPEHAIK